LVLAATGALGGLLAWLNDRSVLTLLGGVFAAAIIAIVWRSPGDRREHDRRWTDSSK
jgi:hypothetical protein